MRIQVFSNHVDIDQTLRAQIETRVRLALGRISSRVSRVSVYLADENGPRGGVDKKCRLVAKLLPDGDLVVQGNGSDWEGLIGDTLNRLMRAVVRDLERRRSSRARAAPLSRRSRSTPARFMIMINQ